MELFLTYLVLFLFGSFAGYLTEVLFRRFFTAKKWVNPGFLKGPSLPLYGFGIVLMLTLVYVITSFFPSEIHFYNPMGNLYGLEYVQLPTAWDLIPIALMGIALNILEFIAGLIFVKGFKVKLWDYTNMRGNILGIVCPLFALIWLVVAIGYYYLLNPFVYSLILKISNFMFGPETEASKINLLVILSLGIAYGFFFMDLIQSTGMFKKAVKFAKESPVAARYEAIKKEAAILANKTKSAVIKPKSQKQIEKEKKKKDEVTRIRLFFAKIIFINPNLNTSHNYDENGRPKKIE